MPLNEVMFLEQTHRGQLDKLYLIELEPGLVWTDVRASPVAKGVKRTLLKRRIRVMSKMRFNILASSLVRMIEQRPLSYDVAQVDGEAAVKAFVASLLQEIEDGG